MSTKRPCWATVEHFALAPDALPRVLAAMFARYHGRVRRGDIRWWQPDYRRHVAWVQRLAATDCVQARGMARWDDEARARWDAADQRDREAVALVNRALRDAEVHLVSDAPGQGPLYWIDGFSGEWRDGLTGGACGERLIQLAMLRWQASWGRAGARLAKLAGLKSVPMVVADA